MYSKTTNEQFFFTLSKPEILRNTCHQVGKTFLLFFKICLDGIVLS